MDNPKLLLFDLDDTLLRSDKTISPRTLAALKSCREKGFLIGICTSRAEHNCLSFLRDLQLLFYTLKIIFIKDSTEGVSEPSAACKESAEHDDAADQRSNTGV